MCHRVDIARVCISIHALLAESDRERLVQCFPDWQFLSTLSLRRATCYCCSCTVHSRRFLSTLSLRRATRYHGFLWPSRVGFLSTLSLRRATSPGCGWFKVIHYFYPRSPCGERRRTKHSTNPKNHFYPRSPCGERLISVAPASAP